MIVYALPYAGGSAHIYADLKKTLGNKMRLIPIELPGHGERCDETCLWDVKSMAEEVFQQIENDVSLEDYCLLGFCMGSFVCFELYYLLLENNLPLPKHIYLCAAKMNNGKGKGKLEYKDYRKMAREDIIQELKTSHEMPEDILMSNDIMDFLLPIIRADFSATKNYVCEKKREKIKARGIILYTEDEKTGEGNILDWNNAFENECDYYFIEGNHLFIHNEYTKIAEIILNECVDNAAVTNNLGIN